MTLEDSVDLVLHAFENAVQGDLFVKKASAATMLTLAEALMEIMGKTVPIKTLGARHGEKMFESLLSSEDMARAVDEGKYYRVPKDNRSLLYENQGGGISLDSSPYTSDNTSMLDTEQTIELLMTVPEIKMLAR
jgi:UDP-glucose 4-epimerase